MISKRHTQRTRRRILVTSASLAASHGTFPARSDHRALPFHLNPTAAHVDFLDVATALTMRSLFWTDGGRRLLWPRLLGGCPL